MATYVRILALPDAVRVHADLLEVGKLARRSEQIWASQGNRVEAARAARVLTELEIVHAQFNRDLEATAKKTVANARKRIATQIRLTRALPRPDTGGPHLRDAIRVRALHSLGAQIATGEVGIADVGVLNALVNPYGPQYGPYWRSQEYGYAPRRKQLTGIAGGFYGAGGGPGPFAPSGAEFRVHPVFQTARGSGDKAVGRLKLTKSLKARHFIAQGAAAAEAAWRADLAAVSSRTTGRLLTIARTV